MIRIQPLKLWRGKSEYRLDEKPDVSTIDVRIRLSGVSFHCYRLRWRDLADLYERYDQKPPVGIPVGYAVHPSLNEIHFWPQPDEAIEAALKYEPYKPFQVIAGGLPTEERYA